MFEFLGERTIYFYALLAVLVVGSIQSIMLGILYFMKNSGVRKANFFYSLLLIGFGLTLLHNIGVITGFFSHYPALLYLPVYYTLSLPVFIFFYVKLNLYPNYKIRSTDLKHFFLPVSQLIFFIVLFFSGTDLQEQFNRNFYNPLFGAFEQLLYIISFFAYLYFSRRYIQTKKAELSKDGMSKSILYLEKFIQVLFYLFCLHTFFLLIDFFSYEFFNINLRDSKPFAGISIMSFAALVYWISLYGFQTLIWGKKIFK